MIFPKEVFHTGDVLAVPWVEGRADGQEKRSMVAPLQLCRWSRRSNRTERTRLGAESKRHFGRRFIHWKPIPADWYLRQRTRLVSRFQGRPVASPTEISLSYDLELWFQEESGRHSQLVVQEDASRPKVGRGSTVARGPITYTDLGF